MKDEKMLQKMLDILENMPTGKVLRMKIGENETACERLKLTMQQIKDHNNFANGYDQGYAAAIEELKKWRNEQYLELKNLK